MPTGKIIPAKKAQNSPAARVARVASLDDYLEQGEEGERVIARRFRNVLSPETARQEMTALAIANTRCKDPLMHIVVSWREHENPTTAQMEEAVEVSLAELGLERCLAKWVAHGDTDNVHVHIAVIRIDPETERAIDPAHGWTKLALERAMRKIEYAQGWEIERSGKYDVAADGTVALKSKLANDRCKQAEGTPGAKARDFEQRTGEKSAESIAQEVAAPILRQAKTWQEVHKGLGDVGIRFELKGSGALLWVGETPVKASRAGRDTSLGALQKRLGAYVPAEDVIVDTRTAEPAGGKAHPGDALSWSAYKTAKTAYYRDKDAAWHAMRDLHDSARSQLRIAQRAERDRVLAGDWKGRGELLNALRSQLAAKQAAERADMMDPHTTQRRALRQVWPAFPDYEFWLRMEKGEREAQAWRQRRRSEPADALVGQEDRPRLRDIRDYTSSKAGWAVVYHRSDSGRADFVDRGRRISVLNRDEAAVLAAMQLATQKWGTITIEGDDEYKRLCMRLAVRHGFRITNPELQADLERLRPQRQTDQSFVGKRVNAAAAHALNAEETATLKALATRGGIDDVAETRAAADEAEAGRTT